MDIAPYYTVHMFSFSNLNPTLEKYKTLDDLITN